MTTTITKVRFQEDIQDVIAWPWPMILGGGEAYLHDGRARNLSEAILWHGGEAKAAQQAYRSMSGTDRSALITFLKSL